MQADDYVRDSSQLGELCERMQSLVLKAGITDDVRDWYWPPTDASGAEPWWQSDRRTSAPNYLVAPTSATVATVGEAAPTPMAFGPCLARRYEDPDKVPRDTGPRSPIPDGTASTPRRSA